MDEQEREAQRALGLTHWYHVNARLKHPGWDTFKQIRSIIVDAISEDDAKEVAVKQLLDEYPSLRKDQILIKTVRLITFHTLP